MRKLSSGRKLYIQSRPQIIFSFNCYCFRNIRCPTRYFDRFLLHHTRPEFLLSDIETSKPGIFKEKLDQSFRTHQRFWIWKSETECPPVIISRSPFRFLTAMVSVWTFWLLGHQNVFATIFAHAFTIRVLVHS